MRDPSLFYFGIFCIPTGLLMILFPDVIIEWTNRWKYGESSFPSSRYIWSTRFGGIVTLIVGIGSVVIILTGLPKT